MKRNYQNLDSDYKLSREEINQLKAGFLAHSFAF